jgi:ribonucleoside-diphosphate reductase alpha chain
VSAAPAAQAQPEGQSQPAELEVIPADIACSLENPESCEDCQ